VTTYSILCRRHGATFPHFERLDREGFGLLVYDEVHLLPAPVFRLTADLQARRRLGLTATLIREDGCEADVFSLIGPKRYDVPWKDMEKQGWIAQASCYELRVDTPPEVRLRAATREEPNEEFRVASSSPTKLLALREIVLRHAGEPVLVIGQYLDQLADAGRVLGAPVITGKTPEVERARLYRAFRERQLAVLVVSRVANFAIDLPEASVCVQISGTFGSRQEEAQRLGRVLRPKPDGRSAVFYTLVAKDTCEQRFALHRQLFLTEQGYRYFVEDWMLPEKVAS
jgi:DNA excision repair protein ERCC-3